MKFDLRITSVKVAPNGFTCNADGPIPDRPDLADLFDNFVPLVSLKFFSTWPPVVGSTVSVEFNAEVPN